HVLNSKILSGNDLARLANVEKLPIGGSFANSSTLDSEAQHWMAKKLLAEGKVEEAWQALLNTKP
ncbi:MAG TPA: hypothetical protein VJ508_01935, partial [Saprospiraceae bacterium]|nr:hypothetical protein [Saprospiraceae bacterium]